MLSAASLRRSHGPIHDLWQYSSAAILGPCKGIGRISQETKWANSWPLAVLLGSTNGPIWAHWQHVLGETVGSIKAIASIIMSNFGPIQCYRLHISGDTVSPLLIYIYFYWMGPCGLCWGARHLCTSVLTNTTYDFCDMGSEWCCKGREVGLRWGSQKQDQARILIAT